MVPTESISGNPSTATHTYVDGPRAYTIVAKATNEDGTFEAKAAGGNAIVSVDPAFGVNGEFRKDFFGSTGDFVQTTRVLANGKVLVAGFTQGGNNNIGIVRYNADGTEDTTFGTNGKVVTEFGGDEQAASLVVDSLGRILIGGTQGVSRYSSDGVLDTSFGINGKLTTFTDVRSIKLDSQGRIFLASYYSMTRLLADGSVDQSFNSGNPLYYGSYLSNGYDLTIDQADRPVLVGFVYNGSHTDIRVARFTITGLIDTSFGVGGTDGNGLVTIDFGVETTPVAVLPSIKTSFWSEARPSHFMITLTPLITIHLATTATIRTLPSFGSTAMEPWTRPLVVAVQPERVPFKSTSTATTSTTFMEWMSIQVVKS